MYSTYLADLLMPFVINPPMYDDGNAMDVWGVGCRALRHRDLCC